MPMGRSEPLDRLFEAVLSLESAEECYMFFEDLCTVRELLSMAQRLEVARALSSEETYGAIAARTGASTATIGRVNRCLQYGAGGYGLALSRTGEGGR